MLRPGAGRALSLRPGRADRTPIRASSLSTVGIGAAAASVLVLLAFSSGGYPVSEHGSWTLFFALVVLCVALVADEVVVDRRSLVLPGALAALALWALCSAAWAPAAAWPVLEAGRLLLYAAAAGALVLVVTRERVTALVTGLVAGALAIALYALATRLFPGRVGGAYDPSAGYQLAEPIGYSNALGMTLVSGLLLAAGLGLRARVALRVLAGGATVPLAAALYFTFSRGALLALALGAVVLLALERRALLGVPVLALAPAAGVVLAAAAPALTRAGEPLTAAQAQGARLAWQLALLACAGAASAWALPRLAARVHVPFPSGRIVVGGGALAVGVVAAFALVRAGGPVAAADAAAAAFREEGPPVSEDLGRRLLSVSGHGRADYWHVAARMAAREPVLGEGAGSFERHWLEERPEAHGARDAHNLYLETLAELGPVGLALLLVALGAPLTGVRRASQAPLVPAAAAAYAAFLAHAGVDWDWELPLVSLPALACAAVLLAGARAQEPVAWTLRGRALAVSAAVAALSVALVGHVGNGAVADAAAALERGDALEAAGSARRARAWQPWSHEPWQLLGEAQLAGHEDAAARRSLQEAIRRASEEWRLWFDLAIASQGDASLHAVTRARELNPLAPEIGDLEVDRGNEPEH